MPAQAPPPLGEPGPLAVLLPGAGSTRDFVTRAFAGPLAATGLRLIAPDLRRGDHPLGTHVADLDAIVVATGARLVGGVSFGAHVAATWAASSRRPLDGLLLALPAWTGPPDAVSGLTAATAEELDRDGLAATLTRVRREAVGWVADELARAWTAYDEADLVAALRATARSVAPDSDMLRAVATPTGLVALADDPFHPARVARTWASSLPRATAVVVARDAPNRDREVLGRAVVAAWRRAGGEVSASR